MINYKKLGRIALDSSDQQKLDQLINLDTSPLISQYDKRFERHGFVEVKDNKYHLKMRDDARSVFQITKSIASFPVAIGNICLLCGQWPYFCLKTCEAQPSRNPR